LVYVPIVQKEERNRASERQMESTSIRFP
jgi:hypothetical protein